MRILDWGERGEQESHCRYWLLRTVVLWRGQEGWSGKPKFRVLRTPDLGRSWRTAGVGLGAPAPGCSFGVQGCGAHFVSGGFGLR